jgi:hypothetical protein
MRTQTRPQDMIFQIQMFVHVQFTVSLLSVLHPLAQVALRSPSIGLP